MSQERLKSFDFQGHKVDVSLYVGSESYMLLHVLQQKLFPSIAAIFGAIDMSNGLDLRNTKLDLSVLKNGVSTLFEGLGSDEKAFELIRRILRGVTVYAKEEDGRLYRLYDVKDFDEFFVGRIELVYSLVYEVLKINYPFFLGKIPNLSALTQRIDSIAKSILNTTPESKKRETTENSVTISAPAGQSSNSKVADFLAEN